MFFHHNSFDLNFREPFGALPTGSRVTLTVDAQNVINLRLHTYFDQDEHFFNMLPADSPGKYSITLTVPKKPGLFWYDFRFESGGKNYGYGTQGDGIGGEGRIYEGMTPSYQITVYDATRKVPKWYKEGIMYQIFPDRFAKGSTYQGKFFPNSLIHGDWNDKPHYFRKSDGSIAYWDYFGGNLEGIIEKLDYIKSLGVSVLYLNPIFESRSNHKYDTADYKKISPEFGDETIFEQLCATAKKKGIHVILDGVFSHTGDDSVYFNRYGHYDSVGAYQSEDSPYHDWYRFTKFPNEFESWWGISSMPNTEEVNPGFSNYIYGADDSVIRKWIRAGASGFRLDVADELPDEFIAGIKTTLLEEKKDSVLIGEVWEDASNKIAYDIQRQYFMGHELDAVMNYPFRETFIRFFLGEISSRQTHRLMMSLYEHYPREQFMSNMNLIGSHDRTRILTVLSECADACHTDEEKEAFIIPDDKKQMGLARLKLLSLLQMTFPGVPCIYYGDEAGVAGFEDPYNRSTFPWGNENKALYNHYKHITHLRKTHPALIRGTYIPITTHIDDIFAFLRCEKDEIILCAFNRSKTEYLLFSHDIFQNVFGLNLDTDTRDNLSGFSIPPLSAKLYRIEATLSSLMKRYNSSTELAF